jgi:hypothetical protein
VNPIFKRVHCLAKQYDSRRNEEICFTNVPYPSALTLFIFQFA